MGIRGELFTTQIQADNRTYFFNVKENTRGDVFLQVVESKNVEGAGFDRHAIVVFEDELHKFLEGFEDSLKFMEKNKRKNVKAKFEKEHSISRPTKKFVKRSDSSFDKAKKDDKYKKEGNRASLYKKKPNKVRAVKK